MSDMAKLARFSLAFLLVSAWTGVAVARQQSGSVADAARRAREKNPGATNTQKVWTNEDIPQTPRAPVSVVGPTSPAPVAAASDQSSSANPAPSPTGAANNDAKTQALQKQLAEVKEQLQTSRTDLDIATRKRALDSQSYYGKPDYASDKAGAAQLDDEQSQIDAKKQEVDDLQSKINDLQAQIDALAAENKPDSGATTPAPADSGAAPTNPPDKTEPPAPKTIGF